MYIYILHICYVSIFKSINMQRSFHPYVSFLCNIIASRCHYSLPKNHHINMRSWNISKTPTTQQLFHFLARLLWSLKGLWGLRNLVQPAKMRRAYWDDVHLHAIKWYKMKKLNLGYAGGPLNNDITIWYLIMIHPSSLQRESRQTIVSYSF